MDIEISAGCCMPVLWASLCRSGWPCVHMHVFPIALFWGPNNTCKSGTRQKSKGQGLALSGLPGSKIKTKSASSAHSSQIPQGFLGVRPNQVPAHPGKDTGSQGLCTVQKATGITQPRGICFQPPARREGGKGTPDLPVCNVAITIVLTSEGCFEDSLRQSRVACDKLLLLYSKYPRSRSRFLSSWSWMNRI